MRLRKGVTQRPSSRPQRCFGAPSPSLTACCHSASAASSGPATKHFPLDSPWCKRTPKNPPKQLYIGVTHERMSLRRQSGFRAVLDLPKSVRKDDGREGVLLHNCCMTCAVSLPGWCRCSQGVTSHCSQSGSSSQHTKSWMT